MCLDKLSFIVYPIAFLFDHLLRISLLLFDIARFPTARYPDCLADYLPRGGIRTAQWAHAFLVVSLVFGIRVMYRGGGSLLCFCVDFGEKYIAWWAISASHFGGIILFGYSLCSGFVLYRLPFFGGAARRYVLFGIVECAGVARPPLLVVFVAAFGIFAVSCSRGRQTLAATDRCTSRAKCTSHPGSP